MLLLTLPLNLGGIVCALAPNVEVMITGRALQGIGSGIVSLGIAMLRDLVPQERLSSAIATVSATLGVGGAMGLRHGTGRCGLRLVGLLGDPDQGSAR